MKELKTRKGIRQEYLRQDFHLHTSGNGEQYYVSDDFQYWYRPELMETGT